MIDYRAGSWGFHVAFGLRGSLAPRALTMAIPNALITFLVSLYLRKTSEINFTEYQHDKDSNGFTKEDTPTAAGMVLTGLTVVLTFILYNRSRESYNRWWEGGTLLQKTRGEWFNAYSSLVAFASTKPEKQAQVTNYLHLLARLMSLLMCCGLQQVSPNRDRPFEIIDLEGIEPAGIDFLNSAPDKVELILQWVQRSITFEAEKGVLPIAPPILSRAYQELSRGIVNLQNARKIADFPYPYPLAQISMILQMLHYIMTPVVSALALRTPWAVSLSFISIFVLWCIHFNALDLEFPFGSRVNDLPMVDMQRDWNNSLSTLLKERASRPPIFNYDPAMHGKLAIAMSDASEVYLPSLIAARRNVSSITISTKSKIRLEDDDKDADMRLSEHHDRPSYLGYSGSPRPTFFGRLYGSVISGSTSAGESRPSSRTMTSRQSGFSRYSNISRFSASSRDGGPPMRPARQSQLAMVVESTESLTSRGTNDENQAMGAHRLAVAEPHTETPIVQSRHEPAPTHLSGEAAAPSTEDREPTLPFHGVPPHAQRDKSRSNSPINRDLSPSGRVQAMRPGSSRGSSPSSSSQRAVTRPVSEIEDGDADSSGIASKYKVIDIDNVVRDPSVDAQLRSSPALANECIVSPSSGSKPEERRALKQSGSSHSL